jgi:Arc/MetJ-type ribon-helix-helix transcriptional regulator
MSFEIPSDVRDRVTARLNAGVYQNEGDVLRDAMNALDQVEEETLTRWHERNRMAIEQSERGLSKPLDEEAVLDRLRQRLANEGIIE